MVGAAENIYAKLTGFCTEIIFSLTKPDGTHYLDWCHGTVFSITSESARKVKIKRDSKCLKPGDPIHFCQVIEVPWKPAVPNKGSWREYMMK